MTEDSVKMAYSSIYYFQSETMPEIQDSLALQMALIVEIRLYHKRQFQYLSHSSVPQRTPLVSKWRYGQHRPIPNLHYNDVPKRIGHCNNFYLIKKKLILERNYKLQGQG